MANRNLKENWTLTFNKKQNDSSRMYISSESDLEAECSDDNSE